MPELMHSESNNSNKYSNINPIKSKVFNVTDNLSDFLLYFLFNLFCLISKLVSLCGYFLTEWFTYYSEILMIFVLFVRF